MTLPRAALGATIICLGLSQACTNSPPPAPTRREPPTGEQPLVTTASGGLELHWWIADDTDGAVGDALAAYADPPLPADSILRERWTSSGLRMVRLPLAEFAALQRTLPALHAWRRRWIGWSASWTELFQGRRIKPSGATGAAFTIIEGERRPMPAGALRFLTRVWPAPPTFAPAIDHIQGRPATPPPTIRFELACQTAPDQRESAADVFRQPRVIAEEDRGPIITDLTLDTTLDAGFIYVITCEAPGVEWRPAPADAAAPGTTSGPREPSAALDPSAPIDDLLTAATDDGAARLFEPLGPPVTEPLTLGEAMLGASTEETGARAVRVVLVLLPRATRPYQLLP